MSEYSTWKCTLCSYINSSHRQSCEMCDAPPPTDFNPFLNLNRQSNNDSDTEITHKIYMNYNKQSQNHRLHRTNHHKNNDRDSKANNGNVHLIPSQYDSDKNQWQCVKCTCFNHIDLSYCEVCLSKRDQITHHQQSYNNKNDSILYQQDYKHHNKEEKSHNNYQKPLFLNAWNDNEIAETMQNQEAQKMKQYYADLQAAKLLQQQLEMEQNMDIAQQIQTQEQQRMNQLHNDIESAKQLEQKYQVDEIQFMNDRQIALKMQKEFAEGLAWFCASCFTMNLNVQSYECDACGTKRPKPKIPDVLTVRDQVALKMIEMLRKVSNINCIVNLAFAQNFVTKYLHMCKQRGLLTAKPKICYHWTRAQFFDPIKKTGLKVPDGKKVKHMTDTGYYGKGIYMSPDPKYAQGYGYGAKLFFAALSLTGKQFSSKYPRDLGIGLKHGYDSHFSSDRVNAQTGIANEWIFFKPEQLLLCFHISLDQVQHVVPVLNQVVKYLVSKYDKLNKKGGIRGL